jgi:hypothetical protein
MSCGSSTKETLKNWRRAPALLALVALALLHISAAAHQFEHSVDHEFGVCQACSAYSELDDTLIPHAPSIDVPSSLHVAVAATATEAPRKTTVAAYRTRAPPLS